MFAVTVLQTQIFCCCCWCSSSSSSSSVRVPDLFVCLCICYVCPLLLRVWWVMFLKGAFARCWTRDLAEDVWSISSSCVADVWWWAVVLVNKSRLGGLERGGWLRYWGSTPMRIITESHCSKIGTGTSGVSIVVASSWNLSWVENIFLSKWGKLSVSTGNAPTPPCRLFLVSDFSWPFSYAFCTSLWWLVIDCCSALSFSVAHVVFGDWLTAALELLLGCSWSLWWPTDCLFDKV